MQITLSNILDEILNSRLNNFLNSNNLIATHQYDLYLVKKLLLTLLSLLKNNLITKIYKCLDIFLHLAKAFYIVTVTNTLNKMENMDVYIFHSWNRHYRD